ncbi:cytoskeleton-associated protein 2-like [Choloepus didactylus]|uniref:cytoskeleton-associated protein 2-like n=1 Tax=Choloepus didactylus TaxID=27675 RepID=UPI00189E42E7|nr:cytoskeleton-associated protein 2-like [Choloepus didactylus]
MVGPGAAAAVEERQRKLQEYLAAKGKLKRQDTKPYLKAKNICSNPAPSKSTVRPKQDLTNRGALPVKAAKPGSVKLQPRPTNIAGPQKPELGPPKLVGKRPASGCVSSKPNCEPSSSDPQQHKDRSSTIELSRKLVRSLNVQESETTKQQGADQGTAKCTDSVDNIHVGNESLGSFLKELNKENLPQTLSDSERKPDPEVYTVSKPKTNSCKLTRSRLAPKQVVGKSSMHGAVLKDRVNKQFVGKTQVRILREKSQQLSRGTGLARPEERPPGTAPSYSFQTLGGTRAPRRPLARGQDMMVNRGTRQRPDKAEVQPHHTKPRTHPHLVQGGKSSLHPNSGQDQKATQPGFRPRTPCVLQRSRAVSQRPRLTAGTSSSRTSGSSGNEASDGFQQHAQTSDSKLKKSLPSNHFPNKTAPKTQAGGINKRGGPSGIQTNPNIKKKATEDRRKQLEEWRKSKGKIYKRPPMELETKRKVIEKMNISFWKSIEEEEEEKKAQLELSDRISSTLAECLQLIEGGVFSKEMFTILSSIPEAEKFAKFWICKAKLLARKGTFDVVGLYEEAIRSGAAPIQELREVVLNILQDPNRTTEGTTSESSVAETNTAPAGELAEGMEPKKSCLSPKDREQVTATPQTATAAQDRHPGIKLQVAPVPRINGIPEAQDVKLVTPVRRSARIQRSVSRYPELLREHGLVVVSLEELLELEETECFIFRKNDALPITLGFQIPDS